MSNIRVVVQEDPPISVNMGVESIYNNEYNFVYGLSSFQFNDTSTVKSIVLKDLPLCTSLQNSFLRVANVESIKIGNVINATLASQFARGCPNLKYFEIGDLNSVTNANYLLFQCTNVETAIIGDLPNATSFVYTFASCDYLKSLTLGDFSNVTTTTNMFNNTALLENVNFIGKTCAVSFSMSYCRNLTHDSIINIFNALPTVDTSPTLTLHPNAKARVSLEEMEIATNKGWTVA